MNNTLDIAGHLAAATGRTAPPSRVVLVGARRDARRLVRRLGSKPWNGLPIVGFVDTGHPRSSSMRAQEPTPGHPPRDRPGPDPGPLDRLDELVDRARATHIMVAVSGEAGDAPSAPGQPTRPFGCRGPLRLGRLQSDRPGLPGRPRDRCDLAANRIGPNPDLAASGSLGATLLGTDSQTPGGYRRGGNPARLPGPPLCCRRDGDLHLIGAADLLQAASVSGRVAGSSAIIKFRSMRCDAERETGPIWALDHDTRCTRIGDWLRHTNIDELPQLWNVLLGEMSLVGPRPERPIFVEEFRKSIPDYDLRHAMPGGMTGWAQVHGWRGRTSLRKRIQYDLDYIQRWTIGMDLRIMLMTIQHVFWGKTSWNDSKRVESAGDLNGSPGGYDTSVARLFDRDPDL